MLLKLKDSIKKIKEQSSNIEISNVINFLREYGGSHISHLNLLNDKQFYYAQSNQVLICYQRIGNTLVVLGDPIGKEVFIAASIDEFEQYGLGNGLKIAYYQTSTKYLNIYRTRNYEVMKLGEEARLKLDSFTLEGKKGAKLRTRKNKFERNGYYMNVFYPPYTHTFLEELNAISKSWLGSRKEKGFSVSFYSHDYVSHFPIAVLYDKEHKAIAFASLACNFNEKDRTITVDLMRYHHDCPHGTMDMLFISIFDWCKIQGYKWCSMGMSPLANIATGTGVNYYEKLSNLIFNKFNYFYNFKGLHEFKNKFYPEWEPRYLVYKKQLLPVLIVQLIGLIHRSNHKTEKKNRPIFGINKVKKVLNIKKVG